MHETLHKIMWEPESLDDIAGNRSSCEFVSSLLRSVESKGDVSSAPAVFPHLLFHGPPGTGKSSMTRIIGSALRGFATKSTSSSHSMFGKFIRPPLRVVTLNASMSRSAHDIAAMLNELLPRKPLASPEATPTSRLPKIVLRVEELDGLPEPAMYTLCAFMDEFRGSLLVLATCNALDAAGLEIRSRCIHLEMTSLTNNDIASFVTTRHPPLRGCAHAVAASVYGDARAAVHMSDILVLCPKDMWDACVKEMSGPSGRKGIEGALKQAVVGRNPAKAYAHLMDTKRALGVGCMDIVTHMGEVLGDVCRVRGPAAKDLSKGMQLLHTFMTKQAGPGDAVWNVFRKWSIRVSGLQRMRDESLFMFCVDISNAVRKNRSFWDVTTSA